VERLGAQDLASVAGDNAGWPWDIGAIGEGVRRALDELAGL
jgi:hypothetical protein